MRPIECHLITPNLNLSILKFPLIIKPRFGSGSRDVIAVKNQDELKNALSKIDLNKEDFLAETLVEGVEYGLSGAVVIVKYECNINGVLGKVTDGKSIINRGYAIIVDSNKQECLANADALIKKFKKETK